MRRFLQAAALSLLVAGAAQAAFAAGSGGGSAPSAPPSAGRDDEPQAAFEAGVQALNSGEYREAIRQFRVARRAAPNDGVINYALGLAYNGNEEKEDARGAFERAARAQNAPPPTRAELGRVYLDLGRRDDAVAQQAALAGMITACDAACGDARRAQLQAAHDQLTRALETPAAPAADPATTGWNFPSVEEGRAAYAEAVGHINEERFADAYAALGRAHAAIGPNADVLNYMGFVSRKLGNYNAALAYYSEALAIDPAHLGATEYLGELYIQMGQLDRARIQLARLDDLCAYGCEQREELARWIARSE